MATHVFNPCDSVPARLLSAGLHAAVVWPTTAFWCDPHDVLRGVFDVTRFAMHAVLGVDLQPLTRGGFIGHELIHAGRTVAAFGACVLRQIQGDRH